MIIGIDLGTTNSLAAYFTEEGPKIIPNRLGSHLTPSVVSVDENDTIYVLSLIHILLSGGSSFSAKQPQLLEGLTEARPGNCIFNDCTQLYKNMITEEDCALKVLVTVVSRVDSSHYIIDAGTKTFSSDTSQEGEGYVTILGHPCLLYTSWFPPVTFRSDPDVPRLRGKPELLRLRRPMVCRLSGEGRLYTCLLYTSNASLYSDPRETAEGQGGNRRISAQSPAGLFYGSVKRAD